MIRESQIDKYLKYRIESMGGLCYKLDIPNRRGVPDRLCILPRGGIYFVEVKRPDGKLRSCQNREISRLRKLEQEVWIVYSRDDVDELIEQIDRDLDNARPR